LRKRPRIRRLFADVDACDRQLTIDVGEAVLAPRLDALTESLHDQSIADQLSLGCDA